MSNLKLDGADLTSGEIAQIKADLGISTVTDASLASSAATAANVSSAVTQMTGTQASPIILTNKFRGLILPQYEGAKGTGFAGLGSATNAGAATNVLKMTNFKFTSRHIGAKCGYAGWDPGYTITSVTAEGWAVLDATVRHTWPDYWMGGHDDTAVLQACIDQAVTMHVSHAETFSEIYGSGGARRPSGGVVVLDPIYTFCVDNTAAQVSGGKKSALVLKPGVHIHGAGGSEHSARIQALPTLNGAIMGSATTTDNSPFLTLSNLTLVGDHVITTNQTHGLWMVYPTAGAVPDLWIRVQNVAISGSPGIGAEFYGAGELRLYNLNINKTKQWGALFNEQNDWKLDGGTFSNTGWAGMAVLGGGPGEATNWKAFFCGREGQADDAKCAGFALMGNGDQMHGVGYYHGEVQETRGASVYVSTGNARLNVGCYDAFSQKTELGVAVFGSDNVTGLGTIDASGDPLLKARPSKRASLVLAGAHARNSQIDAYIAPTVNYWFPAYDTDKKSAVWLDGFDTTNGGPQANSGRVRTMQDTINPGGATKVGYKFNAGAGYPKVAGPGATNGKNTGMSVDGVPLT